MLLNNFHFNGLHNYYAIIYTHSMSLLSYQLMFYVVIVEWHQLQDKHIYLKLLHQYMFFISHFLLLLKAYHLVLNLRIILDLLIQCNNKIIFFKLNKMVTFWIFIIIITSWIFMTFEAISLADSRFPETSNCERRCSRTSSWVIRQVLDGDWSDL